MVDIPSYNMNQGQLLHLGSGIYKSTRGPELPVAVNKKAETGWNQGQFTTVYHEALKRMAETGWNQGRVATDYMAIKRRSRENQSWVKEC